MSGWERKRAARVLGVQTSKCSQAMLPALEKVARLMLADPNATLVELAIHMERISQEQFEQHELPRREAMATGRLDRTVVQPPPLFAGASNG